MNPALFALSRAYMALPGAPEPTIDRTRCDTRENDGLRDTNGIRWTRDSDRGAYNLPDLTDAATGGVLVARFPGELKVEQLALPGSDHALYVGSWRLRGKTDRTVEACEYLAEFAARAAVALGRAG